MDRVRSLIGGRRNTRRQTPPQQTGSTVTHHHTTRTNNDDQITVYTISETLNDANTISDQSDAETLNTYLSESGTIGDMQRLGYVNRSPQFDSIRDIRFVSILLTKGFFAFSSQLSYSTYLQNKRKFDNIDPQTGIGIPLFHAIPVNLMKSIFRTPQNEPIMKIYKYELYTEVMIVPKDIDIQVIYDGPIYKIIKYLYCTIFREDGTIQKTARNSTASKDSHDGQYSKIKHTLRFKNGMDIEMFNINGRRDIDTCIDGIPLRWFGFSSFASPFGSNDIKLLVLDDNMPNLMEKNANDSNSHNSHNTSMIRPLGYLPVWSKYIDVGDSLLPTRRTVHLANLDIKETLNGIENKGIMNIPENTQILTCMCMLLHDYESRKERRHNNNIVTPM